MTGFLKNSIFTGLLVAIVAMSAPSSAAVWVMAGYNLIDIPEDSIVADNSLDVIKAFFEKEKIDFDSVQMTINNEVFESGNQTDITLSGYADDSIAGEEFRLLIAKKNDQYSLAYAGKLYICARGENAGNPQKELCP